MITNEELKILADVLQRYDTMSAQEEKLLKKINIMLSLVEIKTNANNEIRKLEEELAEVENEDNKENE